MNNNEPIVLGTIKKGKTGKPILVLVLFLIIGSILLFLPAMNNYFAGENIINLIKQGQFIDFIKNRDKYVNNKGTVQITSKTTTEKINTNKQIAINKKTVIKHNNFTVNNFDLTENAISYKVITSTNINFDKSYYYLVLTKNNDQITIKLTGEVNGEKEYKFIFANPLTDKIDVTGVIKEISPIDYPKLTLSSDESGLSAIKCNKDNEELEYVFHNNNLIRINEKIKISKILEDYENKLQEYTIYSNEIINLNGTSEMTESEDTTYVTSLIDLYIYDIKQSKNYNYYSLNTQPKVINFEMKAKGYDCK